MQFNKENIEEYLLDYSENNLSEKDKKCVEDFLRQNPKYRAMIEGLSDFKLNGENAVFEKKDSLKHTSEFDYSEFSYVDRLAVSVLEGVATSKELSEYQKLISESASFKKDVALYSQTKLQADSQIVYENKNGLKHFAFVFWRYAAAVAAVLIAGILTAVFYKDENISATSVYSYNFQVKIREAVVQEKIVENITAAAKPKIKQVVPLPEKKEDDITDIIIEKTENETLAGADLSSLRVENVLKNELPQTEFTKILAEKSEPQTKTKTNFIGSRLFRFAKKIDVEVYRNDDGSFFALDLITPNKKYSLKKL